jgi:cell division protein FtsL
MIAIILYTVYVCVNQQLQYAAISREMEATRTQLEQLQQTNEAMGQEKQKLSTPAHVEKLAREELGLVKPGEIPYVR